eukprot:436523_1
MYATDLCSTENHNLIMSNKRSTYKSRDINNSQPSKKQKRQDRTNTGNIMQRKHIGINHSVLIHAYCRTLCSVPDIINICIAYFRALKGEYMILQSGSLDSKKIQYNSIQLMKWKNTLKSNNKPPSIYNLNVINSPAIFNTYNFDKYYGELHPVTSIKLPQHIISTFNKELVSTYNVNQNNLLSPDIYYHLIFDGSGYYSVNQNPSYDYNLYIIESKQLYDKLDADKLSKDKQIINAYNISLPSLLNVERNKIIYDRINHILYSIGGVAQNKIHKLELGHIDTKPEWSMDFKQLKNVNFLGCHFANALIRYSYDSSDNKDVLIVIGGANTRDRSFKRVELIDLNNSNNESFVTNMSYKRMYPGCCLLYDSCSEYCNNNCRHKADRLFVGGGFGGYRSFDEISSFTAEIYDFNKNIWMTCFPRKTNYRHTYPEVWVDVFDKNVVYIAGDVNGDFKAHELGCIEWFDIRENKRTWNLLKNNISITNMFGLNKFVNDKYWRSRHFVM